MEVLANQHCWGTSRSHADNDFPSDRRCRHSRVILDPLYHHSLGLTEVRLPLGPHLIIAKNSCDFPHARMPACLDGGVQLRLASPASPFLGVSPSGCLCCSVALCLCGFTFLLPQRVCCAQQCARLGQHALASEQALDGTAPTKNSSDKQVSSWRHISCHTDKNRYYT